MELSTGKNLVQYAFHQTLGDKFTFQQDNNLKHKAKSYAGVAYQEDSKWSWVAELQFWFKSAWKYMARLKWLSSNDHQPIWQSLKNVEKNNGQMLHKSGVEKS